MIVTWAAQGKPIYVSEDGTIPYISDIGADILKPLFIVGCSFNGVSLVLALTIERILRHRGRYAVIIFKMRCWWLTLVCGAPQIGTLYAQT